MSTEQNMKMYYKNYGNIHEARRSKKYIPGILMQNKIKIEMLYNAWLMFAFSVEENQMKIREIKI